MEKFYNKIEEIISKDNRYKADAYDFVMRSLWFTQAKLKRQSHISGRELLSGIKDFILEQYGPMSKTVLNYWGIKATEDFGEIVFNMVNNGLLNITEEDSKDDFKNVYDFDDVFEIYKNRVFEKLKTKISDKKFSGLPKGLNNKNIN